MAVTYPDAKAWPVAQKALACLEDNAAHHPNPPAAFSFRLGVTGEPLGGLAEDECCNGLGFVRLSRIFPSNSVPTPLQAAVSCNLTWAMELEIGIWRCVPVGTAQAPPSVQAWKDAQEDMFSDWTVMREVICCLMADLGKRNVFVGEFTPKSDPEGGCFGSSVTLMMDLF